MTGSYFTRLPLTPPQIGMRDGHLENPENSAYSQAQIVWYAGEQVTEQIVVDAVARGIRDAESLLVRAGIDESGNWFQQFDPSEEIPTHRVDLSGEPDPVAAARELGNRELLRPLQICGPELPSRSFVLTLGSNSYAWLFIVHHMVIDGYGANLVRARIGEVLSALVAGVEIPASSLGHLADLVAAVPEPDPADQEFWKAHLDGAPEVISFADRVVPPAPLHAMIDVRTPHFVARVTETLDGANWAHVAVAAAISYASVILEDPAVVVGLPVTGRFTPQEKITPSQSMAALPLHLSVDHSATLPDLVQRFRSTFRDTRDHQRQAPHTLRAELPVAWRTGRIYGPMINVIPFEVPSAAGALETGLEVIGQGPIDDIAFTIVPAPEQGIRTKLLFNPNLYGPELREAHAERFGRWLAQIAERPDTLLADLICLTDTEARAHAALADTSADDEPQPLVWGSSCSVADLAAAAGEAAVSGVTVRSALGRPSVFGSPGRVTFHTPRGDQQTDLLVEVDEHGLRYRGTPSDRVVINGTRVELEAVRDAVRRDPRHSGAEITASARRITIRLDGRIDAVQRDEIADRVAKVTAAPVEVR